MRHLQGKREKPWGKKYVRLAQSVSGQQGPGLGPAARARSVGTILRLQLPWQWPRCHAGGSGRGPGAALGPSMPVPEPT